MALRRGIGSLGSLAASVMRLGTSAGEAGCQRAGLAQAPALAALRSESRRAEQLGLSPAAAAVAATGRGGTPSGSGRRHMASAAAPPAAQQQQQQQQEAAGDDDEESIEQIRARIFGTHIGNGERSGRKVLLKPLVGAKIASYYPIDLADNDPYMNSIKAERAKLKLDRLRRRGKAPPKKGSGKRSGKKK